MKFPTPFLALPVLLLPVELMAKCLTDADVVVFGQASAVKKKASVWKIGDKNPYTGSNVYNDLAIKYSDGCELVENRLNMDFSVFGMTYYPVKKTGSFEKDNHRMKALVDRFRLSWNASDSVRVDVGKLRAKEGLFYLKSPASLLTTYYAGFKPTRFYDASLKQTYLESFWGAVVSLEKQTHALSLTAVPKLTHGAKHYESSSNWTSTERANAADRYLVTYTDYRFRDNTPSASLLVGDSTSLAVSNSYNWTPQFMVNAEVAWHRRQQWRHLDGKKVQSVESYGFPPDLYHTRNDDGMELALGMQYTTDRFSQLGVEYYFQSEGYSSAQWKKQSNLVKFLNQRTGYAPLDDAFDAYKYLMASEIYNTSSRGSLQRKHYINAWSSFLMEDQSTIKPYAVINLQDKSTLLGLGYNKPLEALDKKLEINTGIYTAIGSRDSEFGLFGETVGTWLGFKYHF